MIILKKSCKSCQNLLRDSLELDESTQSGDHHSFFTLQPARQRRPVALLALPFHVIPDLAVRTLPVPAKIAIRDRIQRQVLKTTQNTILLRNADLVAHYFDAYQLLVGIEQIRRALFTHRQRQYNP